MTPRRPAASEGLSRKEQAILAQYGTLPKQDAPEALIRAVAARATAPERGFWARVRKGFRSRWVWRPVLAGATVGVLLFWTFPRKQEVHLAWEPAELNNGIVRLNEALTAYKASEPGTPEDTWDQEAVSLQDRITALMQEVEEPGL